MEVNSFQQFRCLHDEAYLYINQAVTQEGANINRLDVALMMYQKGLGILDQALCVDTDRSGDEWARAKTLQQKMSRTRAHVESRILEITDILAPPLENTSSGCEPPTRPSRPPRPATGPLGSGSGVELPSYSEVANDREPASACPPSYAESQRQTLNVETELEEILMEEADELPRKNGRPPSSTSGEEGEVLLSIPDVQIFHISSQGEVTTPSYPETLQIVRFKNRTAAARVGAQAFIEVGPWTYPLVSGRSPVLRSDYGGYLFPDLEAGVEGSAVGLIIPDCVPLSDRQSLESLLTQLTTAFKVQEDVEREYAEYREFSSSLAVGLVKGAEVVGRGMVKGAVKTSEMLFLGADYAKQYITPEETPRPVDPRLQQGLEAARAVSMGACRVSGWMVSKVGSATMALGRLLAPHFERGATRALTHLSGQSSLEASSQLKIVGEVASGTVAAVSTMYMALENSSKILAKNIANNTVMIVSHKYGTDAAAVADAALATAGNSYLTFYNTAALGPKGIAKRVAKDTGKAFIGLDQAAVNERARVAPDRDEGVRDILEAIQQPQQEQPPNQQKNSLPRPPKNP